MGVRDYAVARHQPHPPGYPAYTALAKSTSWMARAAGSDTPELTGLAVLSVLGGGLLLAALFVFARELLGDELAAGLALLLIAVQPLLWFTALRPLSDVPGLAVATAALALSARVLRDRESWERGRVWQLCAAFAAAGLAAGFRSQMAVLTFPLLLWVLIAARPRVPLRVAAGALAAGAAGLLAWAIPLIVVSGGAQAYLEALGSQAGEDFAGVVMLWTHRTPRVAFDALLNTFMRPWDAPALAGVVLGLAAAGFAWTGLRRPRSAFLLAIIFGPYLVFHLLFQETATTRYALPIVVAVAIAAAAAIGEARLRAALSVGVALALWSLAQAYPAGRAYGRTAAPAAAALWEMDLAGAIGGDRVVGMHRRIWSESRRARPWYGDPPGRLLETPRDYEWLMLTRAWREGHDADAWFLADPARTDLALIDSASRRTREYRWPFNARTYVGGARPDVLDWHIYPPPGWFLEQGWAITPETAGIAERDGWGPHRRPSVGWVRRRSADALMMIGGRHLGGPSDPPVRLTVAFDDREAASLRVQPGYYFEYIAIPAGLLAGEGTYARLTARASADGDGAVPPVSVEQFNLQAPDEVQFGYDEGWFEPEYNPRTGRSWRWMSPDAVLHVHDGGRDVVLTIRGESPLRYFDEPPLLRVVVDGRAVEEFRPDRDFEYEVRLPSAVVHAAGGRVHLQSDQSFAPGDRDGSADRRQLALRVYSVEVRGAS